MNPRCPPDVLLDDAMSFFDDDKPSRDALWSLASFNAINAAWRAFQATRKDYDAGAWAAFLLKAVQP